MSSHHIQKLVYVHLRGRWWFHRGLPWRDGGEGWGSLGTWSTNRTDTVWLSVVCKHHVVEHATDIEVTEAKGLLVQGIVWEAQTSETTEELGLGGFAGAKLIKHLELIISGDDSLHLTHGGKPIEDIIDSGIFLLADLLLSHRLGRHVARVQ